MLAPDPKLKAGGAVESEGSPAFVVGTDVRGYVVVDLMNGDSEIRCAVYTVDGDENGEPLCLRIEDAKAAQAVGHYGRLVFHFEEIALTEEDAIRRYRADLLMKAIEKEQEAVEARNRLKRPIRLINKSKRAKPDPENPQLRVRVEDPRSR